VEGCVRICAGVGGKWAGKQFPIVNTLVCEPENVSVSLSEN